MENQNNYSQQPKDDSSNTGTILIILFIIILVAFGYWWYSRSNGQDPIDNQTTIEINVPDINATAENGGSN